MRLYHFTSFGHLPVIIQSGGLYKGEVPIGNGSTFSLATWLTSDPDPSGHGLDGSAVNKREVRITVVFERRDRDLASWLKFAKKTRIDQRVVDEMSRTGGGKRKAETWYIYPRLIPVSVFRSVEFRDQSGQYRMATDDEIAALVPHPGLTPTL